MEDSQAIEQSEIIIDMRAKNIIQVMIFGAAVGLIMWGLFSLTQKFLPSSLICQDGQSGKCISVGIIESFTCVVAVFFGLYGLIKLQVFRPLLVVIAASVSLWGLISHLTPLPWYMIGLFCMIMYMLAYAVFSWIARARPSIVVVAIMFVITIAVRYLIAY